MIALTGLAWAVLVVWVVVTQTGCRHEHVRGVANYYDRDLHAFVHLVHCEDCDTAIITTKETA